MKKILNIILLLAVCFTAFSQAESFENREIFGSIRGKINNHASVINSNYARVGAIGDSLHTYIDTVTYSGGGASKWGIELVDADFLATPSTYYLVDASTAPVVCNIPAYDGSSSDEYIITLHENTHKVTITDGTHYWTIPTEKGVLHIKGSADVGDWVIVEDGRNMWHGITVTEDRDFSDGDGFENKVTYYISPAVSGQAVVLTIPAPATYDSSATVRATFILKSEGSATIVRSDGGYIGGKIQQLITTVDRGLTIEEYNGSYNIVQDSRVKVETNLSFPFYRTDVESSIAGYNLLVTSKENANYPDETILSTGDITSLTFTNYATYVTDSSIVFGDEPESQVVFNVVTRNTVASRPISAYYTLHERKMDNSEVLILTTPQFIISSTEFQQYTINDIFPAHSFENGSLLVMKVWVARVGGVQASQLETKIGGDNGAYVVRSLPSASVEHNDLAGRDAQGAHTGLSISYENAGSLINSDNTQGAISELDKRTTSNTRNTEVLYTYKDNERYFSSFESDFWIKREKGLLTFDCPEHTDSTFTTVVYIDPTAEINGDGTSEATPLNNWPPYLQANTAYLQKRGTVYTGSTLQETQTADNYLIGAYGEGGRPDIASYRLIFDGDNVTVRDVKLYTCRLGNYPGTVADNHWLFNCELMIVGVWGSLNQCHIVGCEIHDSETELIWVQGAVDQAGIGNNITIAYNWLYNANMKWYEGATSAYADGDAIQVLAANGTIHIHNNFIDRSATGNKFCVILGEPTSPVFSAIIEDNLFYPPKYTPEGGACVYIKAIMDSCVVRNNIFYTDEELGLASIWNEEASSGREVYGNLFDGMGRDVASQVGLTKFFNNTLIGVPNKYGQGARDFGNNIYDTDDSYIGGNNLYVDEHPEGSVFEDWEKFILKPNSPARGTGILIDSSHVWTSDYYGKEQNKTGVYDYGAFRYNRLDKESVTGTAGLYDSIEAMAQNDMFARLDTTEPISINSKIAGYYQYNISANDTIALVDNLGYNYAFGDTTRTTEAVFSIDWQNNDNVSELFLSYDGTIIDIGGIADLALNNLIVCYRKPSSGTAIDQVLSCNYSYTFAKYVTPTSPTVTSLTVENATPSQLDVVFSEAVTGDLTDWNIASDGDAISISSLISGDGTSEWGIALSRDVVTGETLTLTIGASNTVVSVSSALALDYSTIPSVTNNVVAAGFNSLTLTTYTALDGNTFPVTANGGSGTWGYANTSETTGTGDFYIEQPINNINLASLIILRLDQNLDGFGNSVWGIWGGITDGGDVYNSLISGSSASIGGSDMTDGDYMVIYRESGTLKIGITTALDGVITDLLTLDTGNVIDYYIQIGAFRTGTIIDNSYISY